MCIEIFVLFPSRSQGECTEGCWDSKAAIEAEGYTSAFLECLHLQVNEGNWDIK